MTTPDKTIEELKSELERLTAENQALLKLASHDMRSPLNKLYALVSLLKMSEAPLSEEQMGYLQNMEMVMSDGLQQMRNLVDLRAIENNQVTVNWELLDISALLKKLIREYEPIAQRKEITITSALEPVKTGSDRLILTRILDQVLTNAVKFSPEQSEIRVLLHEGAEAFTISVIDGGYGVSLTEQPDLFKKFKILSSRATAGETKRGLGLYLAKKNLEKLGGEISYRNKNGSTFVIKLSYVSLA